MAYTGLFGPTGANALDAAPLAGQFVGGFLTVPLAQIIASGNIQIPDTYSAPAWPPAPARSCRLANAVRPVGRAAGKDTGAFLNFATGTIQFATTPEPGTFILAGMGALGLLLAWRRRK